MDWDILDISHYFSMGWLTLTGCICVLLGGLFGTILGIYLKKLIYRKPIYNHPTNIQKYPNNKKCPIIPITAIFDKIRNQSYCQKSAKNSRNPLPEFISHIIGIIKRLKSRCNQMQIKPWKAANSY